MENHRKGQGWEEMMCQGRRKLGESRGANLSLTFKAEKKGVGTT